MPFLTDTAFESPSDMPMASSTLTDANQLSTSQVDNKVSDLYGTRWGVASKVAGVASGAILDLPDQIVSSVGNIAETLSLGHTRLGLGERGSINEAALRAIGSPGLTNWYDGNKGAIEVGSAISSLVGTHFASKAFLNPAGAAMRFAAKTPYVKGLSALERNANRNFDVLTNAYLNSAMDTTIGLEQYNGVATISRLGVKSQMPLATARGNFLRSKITQGLAQNVATEGLLLTFANSNSMIMSDSMSENLLWAAGGLGLGGLVDGAMAKHSMKKFFNSDEYRRTFARANDPFGTESARLDNRLSAIGGTIGGTKVQHLGYTGGIYTDNVVSHMLSVQEARNPENVPGGVLSKVFSGRGRLATQQEQDVRNLMNKVTTQGIPGVSGTAFPMTAKGLGSHIDHANFRDGTAMLGVEELGMPSVDRPAIKIGESRLEAINARMDEISEALVADGFPYEGKIDGKPVTKIRPFKEGEKEALQAEIKQLRFRHSAVEMRLVDGQWTTPEVGNLFADFTEPKINLERTAGFQLWSVGDRKVGSAMAIDQDLNLILPKGRRLNNLGLHDSLTLHRLGNKVIDHHAAQFLSKDATPMVLPKNPPWFQLDMAEELIRRTGSEDSVKFPGNLDRESAMVESFRQKAIAMRGLPDVDDADAVAEAMYKFNLPRLTSYEAGLFMTDEHPIEVVLRGMMANPDLNVSYPELIRAIEDARSITGITSKAKTHGDSTIGNMFQFGLDNKGRPMEQIVGFKRPMIQDSWTKDDLAERLAMGKSYTRSVMMDAEAGEFTKGLTESLLADPDFYTASQIDGLADIQVMPSTPGFGHSGPQTISGRALNDITPREFRDRDTPALLAMTRIRNSAERAAKANLETKVSGIIGNSWSRLNGPRNAGSLLLVNTFYSTRRAGWEFKVKKGQVVTKSVPLPGNRTGTAFVLDETSTLNRERFQKLYGKPLTKDQVMLTAKGQTVAVDDIGMDFINRFSTLANDLRMEDNTILRARGLGHITETQLYAPPPNLKGKHVGYTLDAQNKPVPHGTIIATTPDEFARMKRDLETDPDSPLLRPGHQFYTREDIENFLSVEDLAQMDWLEPGTVAAMPGKRAQGTLTTLDVNPNAAAEALVWARDKYLRQADAVVKTLLSDTINATRNRAQIARTSKIGQAGRSEAAQQSVYDYWLQNMSGVRTLATSGSVIGQFARPAEAVLNEVLKATGPHMARVFRGAMEFVKEHDFTGKLKTSKQQFDSLVKELGPYMPYRSATEFMERQHGVKPPKELAELSGQMSWFESAMRLRMFEVIHPVMNLGGIVNAMPAVIRFAQPTNAERAIWKTGGKEAFAARVGHVADTFDLADGNQIGKINMAKLLQQTFMDAWSRKSHPDWDYMVSRGYVTQEVAELQKQMGVIDSPSAWKKVFVGDPRAVKTVKGFGNLTAKGLKENFQSKGLIGMVSTLSDKSEDFSRSWGHMVGLRLADMNGIVGREARHSYAHDIANKMIANYDPKNRPAIFQGALGAPIGLFQSFIWNYYQRLFRYIETGSARAVATQYATQSALFGITGLTGYQAINKWFFDNADGEHSPYDAIYERFGPQAGDVLMGGVLSNLPKLANLLPGNQGVDGVNLYSRGDTTVRLPAVPLVGQAPPIWDTMKRVKDGITQGIQAFSASKPHLTPTQLAEVVSNMLTNRPIAGFVETFLADGNDTDRSGQLVAQSKGFLENTARVIGVRSVRQSKDLDVFYANRSAQEQQAALRQQLNRRARAAIRAKDVDSLPLFFQDYIDSGGRPEYFNRWMKENMKAALKTRGERMLEQLQKNPRQAALVARLINNGVSISDLENEELQPPVFDHTQYEDSAITPVPGDVSMVE